MLPNNSKVYFKHLISIERNPVTLNLAFPEGSQTPFIVMPFTELHA